MTTFIGLLCAVNVGGRGMVAMAELRAGMEALGYRDVQTLLHSGNVVFRTARRGGATLERALEKHLAAHHALETEVMVRSAGEWAGIIAANPFPALAADDPGHLIVMFLKDEPDAKAVDALKASIRGRETLVAVGRELYIHYPDGTGNSKLTNALIRSRLGLRSTGRNWNTVLRTAALAGA